jgi:tetratricopeptide (TPR) repeat protein
MGKKKTVIKKIVKFPPLLTGILRVFFIVVICLNIGATIYLVNSSIKLNQQLESIENTIIDTVKSNTNDELIAIYKDIDDKTSSSIDRIIAIVGIFAGMITLFGVILAFRAPNDLEKNIKNVKALAEEAKESAVDAKYFSAILDATTNDFNGAPTLNDKISSISKIINKYPDKPVAYNYRGIYYLTLAEQEEAYEKEKHLDLALEDFNTALILDDEKSYLYNNIGNVYYIKFELAKIEQNHNKEILYLEKVLEYNKKILKIVPDDQDAKDNIEIIQEKLADLLATTPA